MIIQNEILRENSSLKNEETAKLHGKMNEWASSFGMRRPTLSSLSTDQLQTINRVVRDEFTQIHTPRKEKRDDPNVETSHNLFDGLQTVETISKEPPSNARHQRKGTASEALEMGPNGGFRMPINYSKPSTSSYRPPISKSNAKKRGSVTINSSSLTDNTIAGDDQAETIAGVHSPKRGHEPYYSRC